MLEIKNLCVSMDGRELLHDVNLHIEHGERRLLSGPNGSGKSTLVQTIVGNPEYTIDSGKIIFDGRDITGENTTTRALMGIFIGAQNVPEIPGLTVLSFLKHSVAAHTHFDTGRDLSMADFLQRIELARDNLSIPKDWLNRCINVGFSGGERKRLMLLQLMLTKPKLAILDEPDSGADSDTQKQIADTIANMTDTTFLFISHQTQFTKMVGPTSTTKIKNGKIIGGK
ncbi:MAG: ATP-binding cassette domain-containing protein [Alphaproteobacteria bacterium]|nr:ATP-binding cassette domain-containing protein [Alphaproteobacteria bacterium]